MESILSESIDQIVKKKGGVVHTVAPSDTVLSAIATMAEKKVGALVVVSEEKVVGIISERDYARKVALKGRSSAQTKVSEIMSSPVVAVSLEHSVGGCMQIITERRFRHLPVLDHDRLVGMVSIGDLVNLIITSQGETIRYLEAYITGVPTP